MATSSNQLTVPYSSSSSTTSWDVFLSFYGKDTRRNFTSHLYSALVQVGISTYMDDPELEKGEEISSGLLNAIGASKIYVVVLSQNYAYSRWCLDELIEILACKRSSGRVVIPVFYYVDPSDLRHLKGSYGDALGVHKKRYSVDIIEKWKSALAEIAELSGYHLKKDGDENESHTVHEIVDNVTTLISTKDLHLEEYLVGIDSFVEEIYDKLSMGSNDVRAIGICGMGGIGKTTTAKAFYNKYFSNFDISCFVDGVKQHSHEGSYLLPLLQQLSVKLFGRMNYKVTDVGSGIRQLKQFLCTKKALIVVDDLDQSSYSDVLVRACDLVSVGSRIIFTTRDANLVNKLKQYISEVDIYMMRGLKQVDSLELFSYHAFRKPTPPESFKELSVSFVTYAGGLPLALEVLGSSLLGRTHVSFWKDKLVKVRKIAEKDIQKILQLSYDELDETQKAMFLDIAFFFVGKDKDEAVHVFKSCNFSPDVGIPVLVERCLLKVDDENRFQMHNLIQDMGKEVIREEFEHGNCRRLYLCHADACAALQNLEEIISFKHFGIMKKRNHPVFNVSREALFSVSEDRIPLGDHPMFSNKENFNPFNIVNESRIEASDVKKPMLKKDIHRRRSLCEHPMLQNKLKEQVIHIEKLNYTKGRNPVENLKKQKVCLGKENLFISQPPISACTPVQLNLDTSHNISVRGLDKCSDAARKSAYRKSVVNVPGLKRRLESSFSPMETSLNEADYSSIERSHIVGFDVSDDDMFSDDDDNKSVTEIADLLSEDDDPADCDLEFIKKRAVPKEYVSLGPPSAKCEFCDAFMWKEERVNKNVKRGQPKFSICCKKGQVKLPAAPPTPSYLWQLYNDSKKGTAFQKSARIYNSMFAFTSIGGTVDHSVNNGRGPYIYRLNGQNHHVFGSLIPDDGSDPKFCQLYIYDTENELENRMQWIDIDGGDPIDSEIVEGLMKMFDDKNVLVKEFRIARDRFKDSPFVDLKIVLKVCRSQSGRENHVGPSNEVAAIMVGDVEDPAATRDIIIHSKKNGLERISNIHPKLMALQYPILFPNGEDGFHTNIKYVNTPGNAGNKRKMCSMKDFYSYKFQVRHSEGMTPRLGGRLFQQYIVDAFSTIEQSRLWWFRTHQTTLRNELYSHICDYLQKGDNDAGKVGKSFILPAGFVGSKRYMQQNFQDALAVCRHVGHPDIFLTMTCNPMWDEIMQMMNLIPGGIAVNNPDIIARVFKLKLDQLVDDIRQKSYFGKCIGVMYVVEFQKRGLPHVHMLIWLDSASKANLKANVDKYVSAEIPDPLVDPVGYDAVKAFMIHGPCGVEYPKCPCMRDYKCTRHFPKKYCPSTMFDESGFPIYKRRNTGITVNVRKADLDNQWVVPYNRDLLVKYQCHINIEICCHARSLKYLFKYCLKGHDRATVELRVKNKMVSKNSDEVVDEIKAYFDGRYICGAEASYRTFGFDIHYRSISVERLSFHLPGEKNCTFRSNESLEKVANREKFKRSKLEAFFYLNRTDVNARQYKYDQIPQHYVWNDSAHMWTPRKRGFQVGRLIYTHHSAGEVWYLRLLLSKVEGPTSFESLRTVDGVLYSTYQDACKKYGLLENDEEWNEVLSECSKSGFANQLRQLFVHIMFNCQVADLNTLWITHWRALSDDILMKKRLLLKKPELTLTDEEIQYFALAEIDSFLKPFGKCLQDYPQIPQPPAIYLDTCTNNLILEETSYDRNAMEREHNELLSKCNEEQVKVYNAVLHSIENEEGGLFFVYGSGGCGKTFLWRTMICKLRADGKIVLPVASSGIAATLLPGGRTAHSRFKIPIVLDDHSLCGIAHNSESAELLKRTSLIIWDEAPMQHRYAFECLDRSLRDIMKIVDPKRFHQPFGGITVLLGGDFRQILPVITFGSRADVVSACITRSKLWSLCTIFVLKTNMRLKKGNNLEEYEALTVFAKWVLDIGDGNIVPTSTTKSLFNEFDVCIPSEFCNVKRSNSLQNMMNSIYPSFLQNFQCPRYLSERAILTPTNEFVTHLNSLIVEMIPGDTTSYFSVDRAEEFGGTELELNVAFPIEHLHSIILTGMPHHQLKLKEGVVVMLMRNLNQTIGLCNGTRMIITRCLKHCVECQVITGSNVGTRHFIPRIECSPSDTKLPFKLIRKQMPLQISYTMTINKSQGQSLQRAGLYLPNDVFSHGQFYVAVSRVTSPEGLQIFIDDNKGCSTSTTKNVVYKEVFYNVPTA